LRRKGFRDLKKNVSSYNSMHLNAKEVYKRCVEKVKLPRKCQCNNTDNNTPPLYEGGVFAVGRTKGNPRLCRGTKNSL